MVNSSSVKRKKKFNTLEGTDHPNNTSANAKKYNSSDFQNTYYLGYRDLPTIFKKYKIGKKAIDYGCGTGRSTRFLKTLGFETLGVDISKEMLKQSMTLDDPLHYLLIKSAQIPVLDNSYDFIFSCFVFLTVASKNEIIAIFKEIHRCLKKGGFFVFVTGSEYLYSHEWLSYNIAFAENKDLKSGDMARIELKDLDIEFINFLWTDADYEKLASKTNFKIIEKHFPLGKEEEEQDWISETIYPPYAVYVLRKK